MEVWGEGSTFDELAAAVTAYPDHLKAPYLGPDTSFRIMLDAWGFAWTDQQQNELLRKLEFIPFQGKVCDSWSVAPAAADGSARKWMVE